MIEVIPDFEMPAVKLFVTAKEQDCTQTNSFEAVPPGRALQPTPIGSADRRHSANALRGCGV